MNQADTFSRMLVCMGGGFTAVRYAARLAAVSGATLTIAEVIDESHAIIRPVRGRGWDVPVLAREQALTRLKRAALRAQRTGVTPQTMRSGLSKAIALDLVMSLLMAVALATVLGLAHVTDWLGGALVGLWAWAGFVLATQLPLMTYENRPLRLVAINTGALLVALLLMGALLGAWH